MKQKSPVFIAQSALIAALYVVVTYVFSPISFGVVQIRISEALTVLPALTPAAVPGLFAGCLIGNILGGAILPDIVFGSLATLIGAYFTYKVRKKHVLLCPLPPIISNALLIPPVLYYGYGFILPYPLLILSIFAGEFVSAGLLGLLLYLFIVRKCPRIFHQFF